MGVIKGTNFRIYDATVPLGYATSCSLSMSAETTETISKDSVASWAESEVDTKSATLSFEGFASEDVEINAVTVKVSKTCSPSFRRVQLSLGALLRM
jgi:hypothetical protein